MAILVGQGPGNKEIERSRKNVFKQVLYMDPWGHIQCKRCLLNYPLGKRDIGDRMAG